MRANALGLALVVVVCGCGSAEMSGTPPRIATKRTAAETKEEQAGPRSQKIERSFNTFVLADGVAEYDPSQDLIEERVTLASILTPVEQTLGQIDRPVVTKMFQQGAAGTTRQETFSQSTMGVLDIVLVIDNSGSMSQEQANLATKLDPLLTYIKDKDWRINVVTTDPNNGCSRALIKRGDADVATNFAAAVNAGINGSGNEQGIRQAVAGLSCSAPAWVRPNSSIAVLIVSDEDNCSAGNTCAAPYNSPNYLLDHLTSLGRPLTTQARVYGLIWEPGKTCSSATSRGHQYAQAITQSGGISGSVCNADYTAPLKAISQDFTAILKAQFELATTPDAGTLQVKVNDVVAAPSTYSLAGRIVTFNSPPPLAATIKATYIVGSTPIVNKFALGERPAAGTLEVKVNGAVAAANLYSVNAAQELVFGVAPAAAAEIRASFRQDVALPARLPLAAKIKPGSLQVQVNGVFVNDVTHDGVDLVFVDAPADAAVIDVAYLEDRGPILTYDLLAVPAILVSVTDATTGEPVAGVSVAGASVVFDAAAFGDGRQLIVRYRDEVSVITSLKLTQAPLPGSLRLDSEDCQLGDVGTDLTVSLTCSDPGAGLVTVRYTYATARLDEFVLSDVTQPDAGTWAVFLDGEPVLGFARVGSTITLPDALRQQFAADTSPRTVRVVYSMD